MPQAQAPNPIFLFIILFAIFYVVVFRPQKKQEKERQKMITSLNKNDDVVTSGGIHGTIVNVKDKTVILRIDDNTKMEIDKSCIAYLKKTQGNNSESQG